MLAHQPALIKAPAPATTKQRCPLLPAPAAMKTYM
jgi:hypothetical protein